MTPETLDLSKMTLNERYAYLKSPEGLQTFKALLDEGIGYKSIFKNRFLVPYIPSAELKQDYPDIAEAIDQRIKYVNECYESIKKPNNLAKFKTLIAQNIPLKTICEQHFEIPFVGHKSVIRRVPELAQALEAQKEAQRLAYRLILGFDWKEKRGTIALTADTPEEIWDSDYIKNYFKFYRVAPDDYKANYLKDLHHKGLHALSNLYLIAYCEISSTGRVLITPKKP